MFWGIVLLALSCPGLTLLCLLTLKVGVPRVGGHS